MVRRLAFLAVAMLLVAGLAYAGDTMEAEGKVTAVSSSSLTVAGADAEWTFIVDADTLVKAKGASHKVKDLTERGPSTLDQFVKADQKVTVKYSKDEDGKALAKEIRVH